jgi:hypothetical protein
VGDYWLVLTNASGCRDTSDVVTVDNENGAGTVISPQSPLIVCEGDSLILTASPAEQVYLWSTGESTQSIIVTEAGTYNVTTINDLGCAGEASAEVTSAPYPNSCTIPDIYGCGSSTDEYTFCAPTADEYAWTSSNDATFLETDICITVTPTSTVTYSLTMTNAGACSTMCDVTVSLGILCFIDNDGDTWGGQEDSTFAACDCPIGWTPIPNDCNDNNPSINPAVDSEICFDGLDNNCSDGIDEGCGSQVLGCTYPDACNYNPDATQDDGSCQFINGCTDPNACNFQENACIDNGSCIFPGCMNELACNYDPAAGCDDGSCEYMVTYQIEEPDSVSANDTVTFSYTGEPGDVYAWEVEDGTIVGAATENSIQVSWPFPGQNEVSLIIQNGEYCSDTLSIMVNVEADPSAILELNALSLEVYPNPTTNDFILKVSGESLGGLIEVFDAIGREVHHETLTQMQTRIDSETWAAGVYTLRIVKDKRTATLRVIKE